MLCPKMPTPAGLGLNSCGHMTAAAHATRKKVEAGHPGAGDIFLALEMLLSLDSVIPAQAPWDFTHHC